LQNKISSNRDRATSLIQGRVTATKHPLAQLNTRLQSASPKKLLKQRKEALDSLASGLPGQMSKVLRDNRRQIEHLSTLLETLGPSATLKRGYAIVTDESGKVLRSAQHVEHGKKIKVALNDGHLRARVEEVEGSQ
jgi:exodeoxyribonuclease VII large subunit